MKKIVPLNTISQNSEFVAIHLDELSSNLLSFDKNWKLKVWDLATAQELSSKSVSLPADLILAKVYQAAFNATGKLLAVSCDYPFFSLILIDVEKVQVTHIMNGHTMFVYALAFSPDNTILVSGGGEGIVKFWSVETGEELPISKEKTIGISKYWSQHQKPEKESYIDLDTITFSPSGELLALGAATGAIQVRNTRTGKIWKTFDKQADSVMSLAFSPNEKLLASGCSELPPIFITEIRERLTIFELRGHSEGVYTLDYSSDGKS